MIVRPAVADDASGIAAAHIASWRWAYRGLVPDVVLEKMSLDDRVRSWREHLAPGAAARTWVAESEDGGIVGFASEGPARDADVAAGTGELYAIYLVEEAAGQGVGAALLEAATAALRARGCTAAVLWVLDGNARARRFYERHGWVDDGVTRLVVRPEYQRLERRYRAAL